MDITETYQLGEHARKPLCPSIRWFLRRRGIIGWIVVERVLAQLTTEAACCALLESVPVLCSVPHIWD